MSLREDLIYLRAAAHAFPEPAEVVKCFSMIRQGPPYDQLFFSELSDPKWLPTLSEAGSFRRLPMPIKMEDGSTRYPWHLPLQGLLKIAATDASAAAAVLSRLHIPDNLAVHDQVLRIIASIKEPPCVEEVLPVLLWLLRTATNSSWLWLGGILENWLKYEQTDACFTAVAGFFDQAVALIEEGGRATDRWRMDDLDNQIIAALARKDPVRMAGLLCDVLIAWAESERARLYGDKSFLRDGHDPYLEDDYNFPGTEWLEDSSRSMRSDHNLEGVAAHRLYAIGEQLLESEDQPDFALYEDLLRSNRWHLFRRLRWQLYADHPAKTLALARREVLAWIPLLRRKEIDHDYEFAAMLQAHADAHGENFLGPAEVASFVDAVMVGTTGVPGHEDYSKYLRLKQLNPIRRLLTGEAAAFVASTSSKQPPITPESYRLIQFSEGEAHVIEQNAPPQAAEMARMSDPELWDFLNTWTPTPDPNRTNFWKEESVGALGTKFAELLESEPLRFPPNTKWWENIRRPEILSAPLERADKRLQGTVNELVPEQRNRPSKDEWQNWLGLASQLVATRPTDASGFAWDWSCILAVKFLATTIRSASGSRDQSPESTSNNVLPEDWQLQVGTLVRRLFEAPDPRLDGKETSSMNSWLSTAINSVRGTALEALLQFALYQRNRNVDEAVLADIFEVIAKRLRSEEESPATFAALGAKLRLTVHLFAAYVRAEPGLLLRPARDAQKLAFLSAHILYDRPMSEVVAVLPNLPDEALNFLGGEQSYQGQMTGDSWREYGRRLGTHLGFYYWNQAYKDEWAGEAIVDRFFATADPEARALTISDIGTIFSSVPATNDTEQICRRAMKLWDHRFAQIESSLLLSPANMEDFRRELEEVFDWIECECFPFEWRAERIIEAVDGLVKAPRAYAVIEALEKYSASSERLERSIQILHSIVSKPSDELRWSYQPAVLKKILERGFAAENTNVRLLTADVQDLLLRQGLFEYLDIDPHRMSRE